MRAIVFGLLSLFVVLDATDSKYIYDIYNYHRPILRRSHSINHLFVRNNTVFDPDNIMYLPKKEQN